MLSNLAFRLFTSPEQPARSLREDILFHVLRRGQHTVVAR